MTKDTQWAESTSWWGPAVRTKGSKLNPCLAVFPHSCALPLSLRYKNGWGSTPGSCYFWLAGNAAYRSWLYPVEEISPLTESHCGRTSSWAWRSCPVFAGIVKREGSCSGKEIWSALSVCQASRSVTLTPCHSHCNLEEEACFQRDISTQ